MNIKKQEWLDAEIFHVRRRSALNIPTFNIVEELRARFGIRRSYSEVQSLRESLPREENNFLHEDIIPIKATDIVPNVGSSAEPFATVPESEPEEFLGPALNVTVEEIEIDVQGQENPHPVKNAVIPSDQKPLSADIGGISAVRLAPVLREAALDNGSVLHTAEPRQIKIGFKPAYVEKCIPGKIYIRAGLGAMECTDISNETVAGCKMELLTLKEIHNRNTPMIQKIQTAKFPKDTIREPASRKIMNEVVHKLEFGLSSLERKVRKGNDAMAFLEDPIKGANIAEVTDVLCYTHGKSKSGRDLTKTDVLLGEKAMRIIASEYAVVMDVDYEEAMSRIKNALGMNKRDIAPERANVDVPKTPGL